jgi:hypothetical protein
MAGHRAVHLARHSAVTDGRAMQGLQLTYEFDAAFDWAAMTMTSKWPSV